MGGRSVVLETVALDRGQEDKVIGRFKADRDEQFREFLSKCEDFEAEIAKETAGTSTMRNSKRMMSTSRNCRRGWPELGYAHFGAMASFRLSVRETDDSVIGRERSAQCLRAR